MIVLIEQIHSRDPNLSSVSLMTTSHFKSLATILLTICSPIGATTVIDTTSSWDGSKNMAAFGSLITPTYGNVFTAPADNYLENASFFLRVFNEFYVGENINYQAFVYAWNGDGITGSALFTGELSTVVLTSSFEELKVNTASTPLVEGQTYIYFLTTLTSPASGGLASLGYGNPSDLPNGAGLFNYSNAQSFSGLWNSWNEHFTPDGPLAMRLEFSDGSAIPEPATASLLMGGVAFLGMRRKR